MSFKTKLLLRGIGSLLIGLIVLILGVVSTPELITYGISWLCAASFLLYKKIPLLKDEEKLKQYENECKDERTIFVAQKSHSFAFWFSVFAEYIAICVCLYFNMETIANTILTIAGIQIFAYVLSWVYYNKKY